VSVACVVALDHERIPGRIVIHRYRARCLRCAFVSPWLDNRGPSWPDGRARSPLWPRTRVLRVTAKHLREYVAKPRQN